MYARVAWLCICIGFAAAADAKGAVKVIDLLRALAANGVDVLYSSELVPPDLEAPSVATTDSDPMAQLIRALAFHHLTLQRTGPAHYLITRAPGTAGPGATRAPVGVRPDAASNFGLNSLSIFASRYTFTDEPSGEPIRYGGRRIKEVPGGAADPMRALRITPGLVTNQSARPYVRGAMMEDVLFRFDGIPIVDPFHFNNFQSLLSVFDPASIGRAEVYTGGYPVRFGTRSGGVYDLSPRVVSSGSEYGIAANLLSYNVESVGHAERTPLDWLFTARRSADPSTLLQVGGNSGEPSFTDAVARVRWYCGPASSLTLGLLEAEDEERLSSHSQEGSASGSSRDFNAWLGWDWNPVPALQVHGATWLSRSQHARQGNLNLTGFASGTLDDERRFTGAGAQTEFAYTVGPALRADFGAEFVVEDATLDFYRQETIASLAATAFDRSADATIRSASTPHESTLGLFASIDRHWRALALEFGVRVDGQDYRGFGVQRQISPRVNLRYDGLRGWHLFGSWGRFSQAQRVDEYRMESNQTAPDPASRAAHLIAGITYTGIRATQLRIEAYRNHWSSIGPYFDNVLGAVSLVPELEPDRILVTPGSAEAKGIEFTARRTARQIDVWGSYTVSSVTDDVGGRDIPRSWDQRQAASIGIAWTGEHVSASLLLAWHSGWPRTPLSILSATHSNPAYLVIGARNSASWPAYFSADLRVSRTVPLRAGELSLWVEAANLTDQANQCCVDLNAVGPDNQQPSPTDKVWSPRSVNVGIEWKVRRTR